MSNFNLIRKPCVMIISGPSGSGKSTLCSKILESEKNIVKSISYTTRSIRPGEAEGREYHYISKDKFEDLIAKDEILEYTKIYDNYYGTPSFVIKDNFRKGIDVLFDIESQGAKFIMEKLPIDSFGLFILPKSMEELSLRLTKRARDSEDDILKRLDNAKREIEQANAYDYIIVNDDLELAINQTLSIYRAERLRFNRVVNSF